MFPIHGISRLMEVRPLFPELKEEREAGQNADEGTKHGDNPGE